MHSTSIYSNSNLFGVIGTNHCRFDGHVVQVTLISAVITVIWAEVSIATRPQVRIILPIHQFCIHPFVVLRVSPWTIDEQASGSCHPMVNPQVEERSGIQFRLLVV